MHHIVNQSHKKETPNENGKLNNILIKTIRYNMLVAMWKTSIFSDLSAPTENKRSNSYTRPNWCSLGSNQEGFEESNPQSVQDPICKEEQRILSLPLHMHLSDYHLELVTSSILIIINSQAKISKQGS